MDDDWDDGVAVTTNYSTANEFLDDGRDIGKGRGFVPPSEEEQNGFFGSRREGGDFRGRRGSRGGIGSRDNGRRYNNDDNDGDDNSGNRRGGYRGRGGRGGGDRGGGDRGGWRFNNDGEDDGDSSRDGGFQKRRGGDRGSSRGGRGGSRRHNDDDNGADSKKKENGDPEKPKEIYIPADPTDDEETMFGGGISSGINFNQYDNIKIKVSGENVPRAINSFEESGMRPYVLDNIKKSGYTKPTPVQKYALPIIMGGRDLMACAQTGSGKTAAFLLPIINQLLHEPIDAVYDSRHAEPQVVIITPTRELTLQIFNEARKFSHSSMLKSAVAYGGTAVYHQAQKLQNGCHILVATPGRLNDYVGKGRVTFNSVRFFVLDEADRMLDMGFLPEIEKMLNHSTMVPTGQRQTLMFSATFPEEIQHLAYKFLNDYLFLTVGIVGGACADVEQRFHQVAQYEKRDKLNELLTAEGDERTLVFVETKRNADFLAIYLSERDYPTTSIHGDRFQREREEALNDFKSGRRGVLVATAVANRGLDIKGVNHVVNYDLPASIDEYVHRIGRTGRVGNRGKATSFYDSEQDSRLAKDLVKILQQAEQEVPSWLNTEGASGSGGFSGSRFGGSDVRKFDRNGDTFVRKDNEGQPQVAEEEEVW